LGGYSPAFRQAEDYEFWLRALRETRLANLPEVLLRFRRHGQNASIVNAAQCGEYALLALQSALSWILGEEIPLPRLKMLRDRSSISNAAEAAATARLLYRLYRGYCQTLRLTPSECRVIRGMAGDRMWDLHSYCRQKRWPAAPVHGHCFLLQPGRTLRSGVALLVRRARQLGERFHGKGP